MKKSILFLATILMSVSAIAQTSCIQRDSVVHTTTFQSKVKMAVHKSSGNILADTGQPERVKQYAQLIITDPDGSQWLLALTAGVMTNVAINWDSSDNDIEFTVNSIFSKYAYAYYRELPE